MNRIFKDFNDKYMSLIEATDTLDPRLHKMVKELSVAFDLNFKIARLPKTNDMYKISGPFSETIIVSKIGAGWIAYNPKSWSIDEPKDTIEQLTKSIIKIGVL